MTTDLTDANMNVLVRYVVLLKSSTSEINGVNEARKPQFSKQQKYKLYLHHLQPYVNI